MRPFGVAGAAGGAGDGLPRDRAVRAQGYDVGELEAAQLIKPHLYFLRQKLEPVPSNPRSILTVRGTGYMLATPPAEP